MAISILTGQNAQGTAAAATVNATYPSTPTVNDLLPIAIYSAVAAGTNVAPGFTVATDGATGSTAANGSVTILYKVAGASEPTTVTANSTGSGTLRLHITEASGTAASSVLDSVATPVSSGATSVTSLTSGTVTTTQANELVFLAWGFASAMSAPSIDSGFTINQSSNRLLEAYFIAPTPGSYSATLSWTGAARAGVVGASFKQAAAKANSNFFALM